MSDTSVVNYPTVSQLIFQDDIPSVVIK